MTPKQADDGVLELGLPNGGSVLFVIEGDVPDRPEVDGELIAAMLAANGEVDDVCRSVSDAVASRGLAARVSTAREPTTVVVGVDRAAARDPSATEPRP
ncbi:MAG TPA: hypothetical protein VFO73_08350 [Candidatus Limnocylindrales bacterium]|nr:hypothetical protein [Candidatus Limnocylindrales bacterium]